MMTLDQRIDAMSPAERTLILNFLEYLADRAQPARPANSYVENPRNRARREFAKAFGERLRLARETLGKSEHEAAAAFGVAVLTYRRYEKGCPVGKNSAQNCARFAEAFGISIGWLAGGTGAMFRDDRQSPAGARWAEPAPARSEAAPASNVIDWKAARARKGGVK